MRDLSATFATWTDILPSSLDTRSSDSRRLRPLLIHVDEGEVAPFAPTVRWPGSARFRSLLR